MNLTRITACQVLLALTALAVSCRSEAPQEAAFRVAETPFATRSLLTAPDVETRTTCITLAAYRDGGLAASAHFVDGFDAMALPLEPGKTFRVYALVNMGDRTGDLPARETELASLTWSIPSYTEGNESLARRGLPMAGKLTYDGSTALIPVERLLSKVTVRLSCDWTGAAIRSVKVCNLNRTLRPFGESAAAEAWAEQEFQAGTGSPSGTFTFYVPENRQGVIPGTGRSSDKRPDYNPEVRERQEQLTYLETVVEGTGLYTGSVTYRSYLGQDAVSGFDLRRNASYVWTIRYQADGLQYQDWKHDNNLTDTRFLIWKEHPDERVLHVTRQVGSEGTRAGDPWRPEAFVPGDSTGAGRIQGTDITAATLLQYIGYAIDTEWFRFLSNTNDAVRFTIGDRDLPAGDYQTRFFFLDRPDLSLSVWLHVRNDNDLKIDDDWDDGGEQELS